MKAVRTLANLFSGLAFVLTMLLMVLLIMATRFPQVNDGIEELRCWIGIPAAGSTCVSDILQAADDAFIDLQRDRDDALAALSGQNLVFSQGAEIKDRLSVIVGTIYREDGGASVPVRSFCYANLDHGGLDPRVGLLVQEADGSLTTLPITLEDLERIDATVEDVDAAKAACEFPSLS